MTWQGLPLCLRYNKLRGIEETDCYDADYALIALNNYRLTTPIMRRWDNIRGECCMTLAVRTKMGTAIYGELQLLTDGVRRSSQAAGISLLADQPLFDYGDEVRSLDIDYFWGRGVPRPTNGVAHLVADVWSGDIEALRMLNSRWPVSKVTGEHHTLVTPAEALHKLRHRGFIYAARTLSLVWEVRGTQAWASGVILWFACADLEISDALMHATALWKEKDLNSWALVAKSLFADLKMHQHFTTMHLQQAFEFQVLLNRGIGSVDWAEEKSHRTQPSTVNIPYAVVFQQARDLFMGASQQGYVYASEKWDAYWARRWSSTPTGSMHSQHAEDQKYILRDRQFRTKFFTALRMPEVDITHFTARDPEIVAWPSIKSEWGKERAIYGTDFTSYELTDFAMPAAEEALSHVFPIGRKANEKYVAQRVKLAGAEGVPVCFDFADFNSQHSLSSMLAVVAAYRNVHYSSMSDDQKHAMDWVIRSVGVQRVEGDDPYTSRGTLLSGWRLTTLVNTVLNRVYLSWSGSLDSALDSVHNGDDVLMYYPTVMHAARALKRAHDVGIRAQPAKCVIAGIGEFLRVDREARDLSGAQYLTRAVATAVHARAEAGIPENIRDSLQAHVTRISELGQRGAPQCVTDALLKDAFRNNAKAYGMSVEDVKCVYNTHTLQGGINADINAPVLWRFEEEKGHDLAYDGEVQYDRLPGVQAYAKSICASFSLGPEHIKDVVKRLARATKKATTLSRNALVKVKISDPADEKIAQALFKSSSNEYSVANLAGKARMAGLPVGRLAIGAIGGETIARITTATNPIRMMQIIF